jgi:SAM-dependent methyltransferase
MTSDTSDIQNFWTESPETYSEDGHGGAQFNGKAFDFGTREFFENVDRAFIGTRTHMHTDRPFGRVFPYDRYAAGRVLEIGCGLGSMAMQWAKTGCAYTAVDLSPMSVKMTSRRFALFGYQGSFIEGDSRQLPLADESFDFGYSWGVLHHSPQLERSLREMMRVIRKGGEFAIMLYNRNSLLYRHFIQFRQGFLNMESQFLDPLALASRYTDDYRREGNPHTWPVTEREVRAMLGGHADNLKFWIHGSDVPDHLAYLIPVIGPRLPAWALKPWVQRYGWSLCFSGVRR